MNNGPGRKKSLIGANGNLPHIDIPTAPQVTNQLLNKSAATSTSLYQKCSQLRSRLDRIHDFSPYLSLANPPATDGVRRSQQATDPVSQLWDCFALGTPLCFIYNLLPLPQSARLDVNTDPDDVDPDNMRLKKKAVAAFIMGITALQRAGDWDQGEVFTVMELLSSQRDTNGFVKVIRTVEQVVDRLPEHVFKADISPPSPSSIAPSYASTATFCVSQPSIDSSSAEIERGKVLRELIETERKYVGDLEVMREYATALGSSGIIDQDTIHNLFPNLNKLLDFQRQFLILLEGIYELPWEQQRWGHAFNSKEIEFQVYEPYCANYTNASELLQAEEQNLMALSTMINPRSELPAFLIKPVQRICKYPLLLESLVKRADSDYPYLNELYEGLASAKRITDRINEAQRHMENEQTVKTLEQRVEDWKGHHLSNFGALLLDEIFFVTKADVDREYHVFLFEKIILCCKEAGPAGAPPTPSTLKKGGKTNSILKKGANADRAAVAAAGFGAGKKKNTPLLLKGRIFLSNVTAATPSRKDGHSLQVWWRGDDDLEYFTLRCRTEEQLKQWETVIKKLVKDTQARRASERPAPPASAGHPPPHHPYSQQYPSQRARYPSAPSSHYSDYPQSAPGPYNALRRDLDDQHEDDESVTGTLVDRDDRGYESPYGHTSGRATPSGSGGYARRQPHHGHASMPASQHKPMPQPINTSRGTLTRGMSAGSDGSFGTAANHPPPMPPASASAASRPALRSQFSSTRLKGAYDTAENQGSGYGAGAGRGGAPPSASQSQHLRLRSQSTPTSYMPANAKQAPPPIPMTGSMWSANASKSSLGTTTMTIRTDSKRGSGSSQSTNDSSEYYSHSQNTSPITPYGSNDSSLVSTGIRPKRSQGFQQSGGQIVKVKVHYKEDIFMVQVERSIEYMELMDRVAKKIRLCAGAGGRQDTPFFRVKYQDEDGDLICLSSDDDLQIALDSQGVTLYVV